MNNLRYIIVASIIICEQQNGVSQGTFVNLDFEHPILPLNPVNFQVPISNALPAWIGYIGGIQQTQVVYNTVSGGDPAITLQGPGSMYPILQGNYSVLLQGSSAGTPGSAAIGQTGQIPGTAKSIVFWGYAGLDNVSFNGQTLGLFVASNTANYNVYEADISAFAGHTGQLLFTAPPSFEDIVDNIQFSTNPAPEPSTWVLMLCGTAVFAFRRRNRKK